MRRRLYNIILVILICFSNKASHAGFIFSDSDLKYIKSAMHHASEENWDNALLSANRAKDPIVHNTVLWLKMSKSSEVSFEELSAYIKSNRYKMSKNKLRVNAEEVMDSTMGNDKIINWFKSYPPLTDYGRRIYLKACFEKHGKTEKNISLAKNAWKNYYLTEKEEKYLLENFGDNFSQSDYRLRISNMLWNQNISQAERLLGKVDVGYKAVYRARIKLIDNKMGALRAYNAVPKHLQGNLGLLYDLCGFYEKEDKFTKLVKILSKIPKKAFYSNKWWGMKARQIRPLIQKKHYTKAYKFASGHNYSSGEKFADGEWLSGWIALRYLKKPDLARRHFTKMYKKVNFPVSLSRGSYWIARTLDAEGNKASAANWYKKSARFDDSFYGQLSNLKLDRNADIVREASQGYNSKDIEFFKDNKHIKRAVILSFYKDGRLSEFSISSAIRNARTTGEIVLMTQLGIHNNKPNLSVTAAKQTRGRKISSGNAGYPIMSVHDNSVDPALIHSIIRQESKFDHKAVSSAGALGLMQLMPKTASSLSEELDQQFQESKLTSDFHFNLRLGTYYLRKLLNKYNGSYILTIAAYNAGPHNVKRWIEKNGDPRDFKSIDNIVDWIEGMTFYETRNYVQRVLENVQVYRAVLNKEKNKSKIFLAKDLTR